MAIYLLAADAEMTRARLVEQRIRRALPDLTTIADINELSDIVTRGSINDPACVLIMAPSRDLGYFTKVANMAPSLRGRIFYVLISDELSVNDYKTLLRRGDADWVSLDADPQEIGRAHV